MNLEGKKFNMLTVLEEGFGKRDKYGKLEPTWICQCDCGNMTEVKEYNLISGYTKSCGCLRRRVGKQNGNYTHGMSKTPIYGIWLRVKARCCNRHTDAYKRYGAKGIQMYKELQDNFVAFYKWALNTGYHDGLMLDRINSKGNFEPSNCTWKER